MALWPAGACFSKHQKPGSSYMTDPRKRPKQEEAYLEAFNAYSDPLFRHAFFRLSNRDRALELTQETFLKAWDYVHGGGEVQQFKSFLYRILNNLIIDEYRKSKQSSLDELLESDTGDLEAKMSEGSVRETEEGLDEQGLLENIRARIPELPDVYREAITMRYVDGFTPKEIAGMIGVTENVVSVRLHRGVIKLKALCTENNL
jgi:RNA polymerase sigma-70 factor (ECF subfamily)